MKYKDMPSVRAREYAKNQAPAYDVQWNRPLAENRLQRAYMAGYDAARKRFTSDAGEKQA